MAVRIVSPHWLGSSYVVSLNSLAVTDTDPRKVGRDTPGFLLAEVVDAAAIRVFVTDRTCNSPGDAARALGSQGAYLAKLTLQAIGMVSTV